MPSNSVFNQLLEKSFEIISDASNGNTQRTAQKTIDIINLLREEKKTRDNWFSSATISPSEAQAMKRQQSTDMFQKSKTKENLNTDFPKFKREVTKKVSRPLQKSKEKFSSHEMDYGTQQKKLHREKNAKIVLSLIGVGIALVILIGVGLSS